MQKACEIERGNGKGFGLQSHLSAMYEALEHYLLLSYSSQHAALFYSSYERLIKGGFKLVLSQVLVEMFQRRACDKLIPWVECIHLERKRAAFVPFALINPLFQEDGNIFSGRSSNGTAIGSNAMEAAVHGLSELIERDAFSIFLYRSFVLKQKSVSRIDKRSVPSHLYDLIQWAEKEYLDELVLLDIRTDLGVPVFLVTFTQQNFFVQPFGTGCSWNGSYALERAVLEAIQVRDLSNSEDAKKQQEIIKKFERWPVYANCVKMPIWSLISDLPKKPFDSFSQEEEPEKIYSYIRKALMKHKIDVYQFKIYEDQELSCLKFISPQLEQFHLCQYGHFAIPGERIRNVCHDH